MSDNTGLTCQYDCYPPHTNPFFWNFFENDGVMRSNSIAIVFEKFHFSVTVFISYVKKEGKTGQTCLRFETKKDTWGRAKTIQNSTCGHRSFFLKNEQYAFWIQNKEVWTGLKSQGCCTSTFRERTSSKQMRGSRQRSNLCTELNKFLNWTTFN